jgi:hypothetical protein
LEAYRNNLKEFEDFIKHHRLIKPEKARLYIYWVEKYIKYSQNRPSKPNPQIIELFLESMEMDSRFADWQVKQAADAILLYIDKYLGSNISNRNIESKPSGSNSEQISAAWKDVFHRLHENMRLRHYSPRTEKSYRIWINKFRKYWTNRDPMTLEGPEVKEFLSHIALHDRVSSSTQNQAFNALLYLFRKKFITNRCTGFLLRCAV